MIRAIGEREWGCMILDEVTLYPQICSKSASNGQRALQTRSWLHWFAKTTRFAIYILVGSKLYEANWIDLTEMGFRAKVKCVEVWFSD